MYPLGKPSLSLGGEKGDKCEESINPPEYDGANSISGKALLYGMLNGDAVPHSNILGFAARVTCCSKAGVDAGGRRAVSKGLRGLLRRRNE